MSSILDALEKLESRRRSHGGGLEPPRRERRGVTPLLAGAALAAFAAGIGLTIVWLRPTTDTATPPVASVASAPAPAATTPPTAAPPATVAPPRAVEQPWAEVVAPPAAARRLEKEPLAEANIVSRAPAQERAVGRVEPPPPPAPAVAAAAPRAAARPAGAPSVRVSFLVYSRAPERRSVALTVDDAGLVTLHEGESTNGLSVVQILPSGVELAWQGQSFTVPARD